MTFAQQQQQQQAAAAAAASSSKQQRQQQQQLMPQRGAKSIEISGTWLGERGLTVTSSDTDD